MPYDGGMLVALTVAASVIAACHGGASDVVGGGGPTNAHTSITLVAYSVPEPGWSKVIPAFNASQEGKGVQVITSYGASGDQSRGVVDGKPADLVNFSVEPDITRLVKAGKVSKDWDKDATKGIPFGSVVTLVVRPGQSQEHQGLGRPAAARRGGHHAQPAEFRLGEVESACARTPSRAAAAAIRKRASTSSTSWWASTSNCAPDRGAKPPMCSSRAAVTS